MSEYAQVTVVIPAYRPEPRLIHIVDDLLARGFADILVVDDGSGRDFASIFDAISEKTGVELLRHELNLGKGAALKTAFHHAMEARPHSIGVVTVDADGQHLAPDVQSVADILRANPQSLVLGARQMSKDVPLRSRFGNEMTVRVFDLLVGRKLIDTQTGLRGIPSAILPDLITISAQRYEFELEMLIKVVHMGTKILECPIATVYEEGNKTSHFNPLRDSFRIYFVFLRFSVASLLVYFADLIAYSIAFGLLNAVFGSLVVGRLCGAVVGFALAKNFVFRRQTITAGMVFRYGALWLVLLGLSYVLILGARDVLGMNVYVARAVTDFFMFFLNFLAQRTFVFLRDEE